MRADLALGVLTVLMAVLGGVVSIHAPGRWAWKIVYVVAFVALAALAIVFVIKQSNDAAKATADIKDNLQHLSDSASEISRVTSLNTQLQEKLLRQGDTITKLAKQNISEATGGDSFCYVIFSPMGGSRFLITAVPRGKFPLHNINGFLSDLEKLDQATSGKTVTFDTLFHPSVPYSASLPIGDLPRESAHTGKTITEYSADDHTDFHAFNVTFSGLNGSWLQMTQMRRIGGTWLQATRVISQTGSDINKEKTLYERVDSKYPRQGGKIDWLLGHWKPLEGAPVH
jgi:hypothetical protein